MTTDTCTKIKTTRYFFRPWKKRQYEEVEHDWGYISTSERECKVCKLEQLYFGSVRAGGSAWEDWRDKL